MLRSTDPAGPREGRLWLLILTLLGGLLLGVSARAERIYLRNGGELEGEIVKETKEGLWVSVPGGRILLKQNEILKIEPSTPKEEEPGPAAPGSSEGAATLPQSATPTPPDGPTGKVSESASVPAEAQEEIAAQGTENLPSLEEFLEAATDAPSADVLIERLLSAGTPEAEEVIWGIVATQRDKAPPAAIRALGQVRSRREDGIKLIAELLHSQIPHVRWESAEALVSTGELGALLEALENPDPIVTVRIVRGIGEMAQGERRAEIAQQITKASLDAGRPRVARERMVRLLGSVGGEESLDALELHLFGGDKALSVAAAKSLGALRSPRAGGLLVSFAAAQRSPAQRAACYSALMGIPSSSTPRLLPYVIGDLEDSDPAVQEAAAELLAHLTGLQLGKNAPGWIDWWRRQSEPASPRR